MYELMYESLPFGVENLFAYLSILELEVGMVH